MRKNRIRVAVRKMFRLFGVNLQKSVGADKDTKVKAENCASASELAAETEPDNEVTQEDEQEETLPTVTRSRMGKVQVEFEDDDDDGTGQHPLEANEAARAGPSRTGKVNKARVSRPKLQVESEDDDDDGTGQDTLKANEAARAGTSRTGKVNKDGDGTGQDTLEVNEAARAGTSKVNKARVSESEDNDDDGTGQDTSEVNDAARAGTKVNKARVSQLQVESEDADDATRVTRDDDATMVSEATQTSCEVAKVNETIDAVGGEHGSEVPVAKKRRGRLEEVLLKLRNVPGETDRQGKGLDEFMLKLHCEEEGQTVEGVEPEQTVEGAEPEQTAGVEEPEQTVGVEPEQRVEGVEPEQTVEGVEPGRKRPKGLEDVLFKLHKRIEKQMDRVDGPKRLKK